MLTKEKIAFEKLNGVLLNSYALLPDGFNSNDQYTMTLNAELMNLGFIMNKELYDAVSFLFSGSIENLANVIIPLAKEAKGAHVKHKPMYPNFPEQVMNMSEFELYFNAILHYWSFGTWLPEFEKEVRKYKFEKIKPIELKLISEDDFNNIFTTILSSNDSISQFDKEVVEWFLDNIHWNDLMFPEIIPHKENLALVAGWFIGKGKFNTNILKTATDVLRTATYMSGGDVSLAENTKFKSFPRSVRRAFTNILENVISEEDVKRHKNKWNKLFHSLHVGEYNRYIKVNKIAAKLRNNKKLESFNGKVEELIFTGNVDAASRMLVNRPGDFARRLDKLLRMADSIFDQDTILNLFESVAHKISTRVLFQLLGHFNNRNRENRIVFPKGSVQKAYKIDGLEEIINDEVLIDVINIISNAIIIRLQDDEDIKSVFIDRSLEDCPLPTQQRSVNKNFVARGTKMDIDFSEKKTLRFFVYWKGRDIDLSATFHGENFEYINHISYTNLKSDKIRSYHSGDITYAPDGASEFIDVDTSKLIENGIRYIVMNVFVYSGPNFKDHETCFAGWMTRKHPDSNEIFEAKTVENKFDITADSRNAIPVVFDVVENKAIWFDLSTPRNNWGYDTWRGNNIENNMLTIGEYLCNIVSMKGKSTLYDLFGYYAAANGLYVKNEREEADIVFAWDGDVTPMDINIINSKYLK